MPVFSSPAIESHLHRIPGLSKNFIYFNDDVFLGAPTKPEDFMSVTGAQKFHLSWDVPKCAPGCSDSWIGDGFCDRACNVSACNFDFPDCANATTTGWQSSIGDDAQISKPFCSKGCPDSWLGDKVCDARCKNADCGWDMGDCDIGKVVENFPGVYLSKENSFIGSTDFQSNFSLALMTNVSHALTNSSHIYLKKPLSHLPVTISVPIGTKAVYFNLTNLLDETKSDNVSIENHFQYISGNHSASKVVHNAMVLWKHNILLVTLYSDQDDVPEVPSLPHYVHFEVNGKNSVTNVSRTAEIILEVVPNSGVDFRIQGYPNHTVPIKGYAAACALQKPVINVFPVKKVSIADRPFALSNWGEDSDLFMEGISLTIALGTVTDMFASYQTNETFLKYSVSSYGQIHTVILPVCDAIGIVSSPSYLFEKSYSKNLVCPKTMGALIENESLHKTHNDMQTQFDPESKIPKSYFDGERVSYLTIMVPVPQECARTTGRWVNAKVQMIHAEDLQSIHLLQAESMEENEQLSIVSCISASFEWAPKLMTQQEIPLIQEPEVERNLTINLVSKVLELSDGNQTTTNETMRRRRLNEGDT